AEGWHDAESRPQFPRSRRAPHAPRLRCSTMPAMPRHSSSTIHALALACLILPVAQTPTPAPTPTRMAILNAEDHRAQTPEELETLRAGLKNPDYQIVRIAARAIGRLERPELIADLKPLLLYRQSETRAEVATAIGQAAQGWRRNPPEGWIAALGVA